MSWAMKHLTNSIFEWDPQDLTERAYGPETKIPNQFTSILKWQECFLPLIVEDCRCSCVQAILKPADKLHTCRILAREKKLELVNCQLSEEELEAFANNICLLFNKTEKLGSASYIIVEGRFESSLKFKCSLPESLTVSPDTDIKIQVLTSFTPVLRTYERLSELEGKKAPSFMQDLLTGELRAFCEHFDADAFDGLPSYSETLNESQVTAIQTISYPSFSDSPCIHLLHGPPGTGKTTTLVDIIFRLFLMEKVVSVTASSNKAVLVLADRFLKILKRSNHFDVSKVLLFGNPARLEIDESSDVSEIFLGFRIKRLKQAKVQLHLVVASFVSFLQVQEKLVETTDSPRTIKTILDKFDKFSEELESLVDCIVRESIIPSESKEKALSQLQRIRNHCSILKSNEHALLAWIFDHTPQSIDFENCLRTIVLNLRSVTSVASAFLGDHKSLIGQARVVFSTASSAASQNLVSKDFDVCIVDEATQLVEAHTALVLKPTLKCLVLSGDHLQLPATVISQSLIGIGYSVSLFERLIKTFPRLLLDTQYRMTPEILKFPNQKFYNNEIKNSEVVSRETYIREWADKYPPVLLLDASHGVEETDAFGSIYNEFEVAICKFLVNDIAKIRNREMKTSVGIISPYKAQVKRLQHIVSNYQNDDGNFNVDVFSVDGCQGQEFDFVIFTAVRANQNGNVGFHKDMRRLNVAITRPRFNLVIVCHATTVQHNPVWRDLVNAAKERRFFHDMKSKLLIEASKPFFKQCANIETALEASSHLFEECPWHLIFSNEFKNDFVGCNCRKQIISILLKIGKGIWPKQERDITTTVNRLNEILHVYHSSEDICVIWSVDIRRGTKEHKHKQQIILWNLVGTRGNSVSLAFRRIEKHFNLYTNGYLDKCSQKCKNQFNKFSPIIFEANISHEWFKSPTKIDSTEVAIDNDEKNRNSVKFYHLSSDALRILVSSKDANFDLPFEVNGDEMEIIEHPGSALILGRSGTGKTTVMLQRMLKEEVYNRQLDGHVPLRTVFITASPLLCDAIKRNYEGMLNTLQKKGFDSALATEISPSELCAHTLTTVPALAFPLIITYDSLLRLISNTIGTEIPQFDDIISFQLFEDAYYPRFPEEVSKKIDASVVFTEIRSSIKGSMRALHTATGKLSLDQYLVLSKERSSDLSEASRRLVYEAFEKYEKCKADRREVDMEDIVFDLYRQLQTRNIPEASCCTSVYVDEVQDLAPSQIVLLKFICPDVTKFIFAGDTAQTIAQGVSFRFEALKDIFFTEYLGGQARELTPKLWGLTVNFRTHNGILFLARNIIELIEHFFPNSIDRLQKESSLVSGPLPICLKLGSSKNLVTELFGTDSSQTLVDFGAEQAILVRDNESKQRLRSETGGNALILTVLECKGMEFDDCLVVDFFSSSPCRDDWRLILALMHDPPKALKKFDSMKHSILKTELKMLYVLITRTKQRLVIYDQNASAFEPLLKLWTSEKLVTIKTLDEDIRAMFNMKSTPEEWLLKANAYLAKKLFYNAKFSFRKAGDIPNERLATAMEFEDFADRSIKAQGSLDPDSKSNLINAAVLFVGLSKFSDAARCYSHGNENKLAAQYYEQLEKWNEAGVHYERASLFTPAGNCFWKSNDIGKAVECGYINYEYQKILDNLATAESKRISFNFSEAREDCAEKAAIHYHENADIKSMMQYLALFPTFKKK